MLRGLAKAIAALLVFALVYLLWQIFFGTLFAFFDFPLIGGILFIVVVLIAALFRRFGHKRTPVVRSVEPPVPSKHSALPYLSPTLRFEPYLPKVQDKAPTAPDNRREVQPSALLERMNSFDSRYREITHRNYEERTEYKRLLRIDPALAQRYIEELPLYHDHTIDERSELADELDGFLDELCDSYLSASDDQRALTREAVGSHPLILSHLNNYAARLMGRFTNTLDISMLRFGLAAVSINDGRDLKDYDPILSSLYVAVKNSGIDPRPYFRLVARLSNPVSDTPDVLEAFCEIPDRSESATQ